MIYLQNLLNRFRIKFTTAQKRAELLRRTLNLEIGNGCEIYQNVSFGSEPYLISIGNYVRITANVNFITHDGGMWVIRNCGLIRDADKFGRIVIGNNVHIGINAIIMPNVIIGDNVVIGAGAIVTHDIPSNSIAVGIPARVIKTIDEYYEKSKDAIDFTKNMKSKEKENYLRNKYLLCK